MLIGGRNNNGSQARPAPRRGEPAGARGGDDDRDARPLRREELPWSSSEGGDDARHAVVVEPPPAGGIRTVVGAAAERDGRKFAMSIDMLRGIKDKGPSPGAGH